MGCSPNPGGGAVPIGSAVGESVRDSAAAAASITVVVVVAGHSAVPGHALILPEFWSSQFLRNGTKCSKSVSHRLSVRMFRKYGFVRFLQMNS